jgi:hypothetical protein
MRQAVSKGTAHPSESFRPQRIAPVEDGWQAALCEPGRQAVLFFVWFIAV